MEINIPDLPGGTRAEWAAKTLHFNFDARTSRGAMRVKDTFYVLLTAPDGRRAIGEVPLFLGLSAEDTPRFADVLAAACADTAATLAAPPCSSVAFGFESAAAALAGISPSAWSEGAKGLPINGLVWMADKTTMRRQLEAKIAAGFGVVKLKIGGIDFDDELELVAPTTPPCVALTASRPTASTLSNSHCRQAARPTRPASVPRRPCP